MNFVPCIVKIQRLLRRGYSKPRFDNNNVGSMTACGLKLAVLGLSFIQGLRDYIESTEDNYNLPLLQDNFCVSFYTGRGLTLNRLVNTPELYSFPQGQDLCFLQIKSKIYVITQGQFQRSEQLFILFQTF